MLPSFPRTNAVAADPNKILPGPVPNLSQREELDRVTVKDDPVDSMAVGMAGTGLRHQDLVMGCCNLMTGTGGFDRSASVGSEAPAVVQALLDAGANPKARNMYGRTAVDLISYDSPLYDTDVYWQLNDASF